jgi:general secretion pathway protein J
MYLRQSRNIKGFTLMEILIAIFILAIVMSTLYASYSTTFRNIDETEYQAEIYAMARTVMARIAGDLESAYIYSSPGNPNNDTPNIPSTFFTGKESSFFGRSSDTLSFSSRAHLDFQEDSDNTGRANISYYIKESNDNETLTLYRSDSTEFQQAPQEGEGGLILCEDLYSIDFKFYDKNGEASETWDSTNDIVKDTLPVMVSVKIEFVNRSDEESPFKFMTAVSLQLTTGTQS